MASRRPWVGAPARRLRLPLVLALIAGASTAGVAAWYLPDALANVRRCGRSSAGSGCTAHAFWGLAPEQFLAACAIGLLAGGFIALLGFLAYRGVVRGSWGGYAVTAASFAGVFAYGGFGLGVVAGIVAGWILTGAATGRAAAPSEWSGSLPRGVPPAPKPRPRVRVFAPRPPVTEWDGIFAAVAGGPGTSGRPKPALPTADRLAEALRKSRVAPSVDPGRATGRPPVVVLPPPPLGLRGSVRSGPVPGVGNGPVRQISATATHPPASGVRLPPVGAPPPVRGGVRPSATTPSSVPARPAATVSRAPTGPAPSPAPGARRGPLREFRPATLASVTSSAGRPAPPPAAAGPPAPPTRASSVDPRSSPAPPPLEPRAVPPPVRPAAPSPAPAREMPSPLYIPPPPPGQSPTPAEPSRARPPRAWRCPNCKLVNAPWSSRCTRCRTASPNP